MKRGLWLAVCAVVLLLGNAPVSAQDADTLALTVTFAVPSNFDNGEKCGVGIAIMSQYPGAGQVIVRNANGTITGVMDLVRDPLNPSAETPGVARDGQCVITGTLPLEGPSFFTTFTVGGLVQWTMSRDELAAQDWKVTITLPTD